jgi:HAMP domain-containing protein
VQNGAWLGFLVTLALLSFVFLSRALQRDVLSRLENLRRGLAMVMAGDLQRRLAEDGSDELTGIARHFNALLDYYQKIEARGRGRLAMERRLVLALLAICGEGAVLYDLKGDRLAGGKAAGGKPDPLREWITGPGREAIERSTAGDAPSVAERVESGGGEAVEATLLTAGEQPVAWLVRPAAPG